MANINRVVLVGNLTRDPELRHTGGGTAVCNLRIAVNTRRKDGATGEWADKPNYFDVAVFGNQAESCGARKKMLQAAAIAVVQRIVNIAAQIKGQSRCGQLQIPRCLFADFG